MSEQSPTTGIDEAGAGARVVRGSFWELAAFLLPQIYVLVSSAAIARYLGPEGIGRIAFIISVQTVVTTTLVLGLPLALVRYIARLLGEGRDGQVGAIVRWSWRVEAIPAVMAAAALVVVGFAGGEPSSAWVLAGLLAGFSVLHTVPSAFLMGAQRWREARIIGIASGFVAVVAKLIVLAAGGGIVDLFLIDALVAAANLVGTAYLARRVAGPARPAPLDRELRTDVVKFAGVASIGVVIAFVVGQRVEVLFLGHYASDAEIARYAIPFSLVAALLILPSAVASAFSPAVASLWGAGEIDRIRSGFSRALRLVVFVAIAITGIAIAVGTSLIELVFGSAFADTRDVLVLLVLTLPFMPLAYLSTSMLRGVGRQWGLTIIGGAAAVANIALAFLLVPPYGAIGAALANTIAQVAYAVPLLVYALYALGGVGLRPGDMLRGLVVGTAATAAGVGAVAVLPLAAGFVVGSLAFAAAFLAAGFVMRPMSGDDAVWLESMLGRHVGRVVSLAARSVASSAGKPVGDGGT